MMGFVLLSHQNGPQTRRLVECLNRAYETPPIVCHHDISQSPRPALPPNVRFVDSLQTRWGHFSLVEATLRALAMYASISDREWVTLLSGADYPVAPAREVCRQLARDEADVFTEIRRVDPMTGVDQWTKLRADRYWGTRMWIGHILRGLRPRAQKSIGFRRYGTIFDERFRCYAGSQWFTANRRAVSALLTGAARFPALARRYRWVFCADESYVQTVLGNTDGVRISPELHRYQIWKPAPINLRREHLPSMLASDAWFARKVDGSDMELLDALDQNARAATNK